MFIVSICETRSKHTEGEVSDLVFYAQSTSTVILGQTESKTTTTTTTTKMLIIMRQHRTHVLPFSPTSSPLTESYVDQMFTPVIVC